MKVTLNCMTVPLVKNEHDVIMAPEEYLIYCARLSAKERKKHDTAAGLMNYLIRSGHWSPFEMISIGIEIKTSRAIAQQILRHRSFSFQEFSQRYAEVTDMEPMQFREQAVKNRQSSTDEVDPSDGWQDLAYNHVFAGQKLYGELIEAGIAKECARMILPLTTQTTLVMHGTLRSWIHFFNQRCSEHAQLEIQEIAYAARNKIAKVCPWTAEALGWEDVGNANE